MRRLVTVAHFIRLTVDEHLPERIMRTLRIQPDDLLLVMVIDEGFHRLDGGEHRSGAKKRRQGAG